MKKKIERIKFLIGRVLLFTLSTSYLCITGKQRKYNSYLKSIKNKHKEKRCFIIGNGPSLTKDDLEKLSNEITFASNRIYNIFDETEWRPTYYAIFDDTIITSKKMFDKINSINCDMKFFRQNAFFKLRHIKNPVCYIHGWWHKKHIYNPKFSSNLSKGIYSVATVTYSFMQIAKYMGIDEIYLLGIDHKYANEKKEDGTIVKNEGIKSYFGNQEKESSSVVASMWQMESVYKYAEKYSRENGFRIYNATRGGYLEVFERVNLDDVLNTRREKQ